MPKFNERGVTHILLLILLLGGIAAGVFLVQKTQIFKPKAGGGNMNWVVSDNDPDNCVTVRNGQKVTTCPKVKFSIDVPIQVSRK